MLHTVSNDGHIPDVGLTVHQRPDLAIRSVRLFLFCRSKPDICEMCLLGGLFEILIHVAMELTQLGTGMSTNLFDGEAVYGKKMHQ